MTIDEDALLSRLTATEARLRQLEARLDTEARQRRGLMRDTRRCPACQQTKILHAEQMISELHGESIFVASGGFLGYKGMGKVQLFICATCGYGEVQLASTEGLEGKKSIRVLDATEGEGPYR